MATVTTVARANRSPQKVSRIMVHFEADAPAYEKIKSAFDDIRKEIDAGITGNADEYTALQKARSCLFKLGQLVREEVYIVPVREHRPGCEKIEQGGMHEVQA